MEGEIKTVKNWNGNIILCVIEKIINTYGQVSVICYSINGEEIMNKKNLKFKRTTTDKIQVKGILSEDGTTVTYEDDNKIEQEIKVADLLNAFINQSIDLSVSLKTEEDLDVIPTDNE